MLLLIDNYDSFTFNLVHYLQELNTDVQVWKNDGLSVAEAMNLRPMGIVLSPGPRIPDHAGICLELTRAAAQARLPLLGVCLGHQTIGQAFGGRVTRHSEIVRGKMGKVHHVNSGVFAGLPSPFAATRCHSLVLAEDGLPECLHITARLQDGTIMGVQHKSAPIHGVQFHPESIAAQHGHAVWQNSLNEMKVPA